MESSSFQGWHICQDKVEEVKSDLEPISNIIIAGVSQEALDSILSIIFSDCVRGKTAQYFVFYKINPRWYALYYLHCANTD